MSCALYRHFDADGTLLYVGVTRDLTARMAEHQRNSFWWASVETTNIEWVEVSRALAIEASAIASDRPIHNDMHRPKELRLDPASHRRRGASQTTPARWKQLADAGLTPAQAAHVEGKTPAAARKAASLYGFSFLDARRRDSALSGGAA